METIKFHCSIYPLKAIKLAIKDFNHLAHFKVKQKNEYFVVTINKINPQVKKVLKQEFSNYILAAIRNY